MYKSFLMLAGVLALFSAAAGSPVAPPFTVARVFGDYMVLQHGIKLPVWGTAAPGTGVQVAIAGQNKAGTTGPDGRWQVVLDSLPTGKELEMKVFGPETIVFSHILVGDVWICGGQSNMEMPVAGWGGVLNFQQEVASANYPHIRLMTVKQVWSKTPLTDIQTEGWKPCSPATVGDFSATGYFFGREIHAKTNLPIGLISCNWGGTPAEAWMSESSLRAFPEFAARIKLVNASNNPDSMLQQEYQRELDAWSARLVKANAAADARWHEKDLPADSWKPMTLPGLWENAGLPGVDGVVWFRKKVQIPASWQGKKAVIHLGAVDDIDQTWINGVKVGSMTRFDAPRIYALPAEALNAGGELTIAVKAYDTGGGGGLWSHPDSLYLACEGEKPLSLAGSWDYRVAFIATPAMSAPESPNVHYSPTVLYNGMLRPMMPYGIKGAIWYQGETNVPRAHQYRTLFPAMIRNWRTDWKQGEFPFLFTQLANYMMPATAPAEDAWAELREAQQKTLALPHTGMAVAIDIGDAADIHPKNKQEVGRRLALVAERDVYHLPVEASGPVYTGMVVDGSQIRLRFAHAAGMHAHGGDSLRGFAIAGKDRKFYWAEARIEGETVVVSCPQVPHPVAVRYAWAANPVCNLYNAAELPAPPFRTDHWKGITEGVK